MPNITCAGTHIRFAEGPPKPKTLTWYVVNRYDDICLANIEWYAPWRKYAWFPKPNTVYEWVCLREIAQFCEDMTASHRLARKEAGK
jgi:hypothetical protein